MDRVLQNPALKARILQTQEQRLEDFSYENVRALLIRLLQNFVESK